MSKIGDDVVDGILRRALPYMCGLLLKHALGI
jgi:hypothetical protein